MQQKKSFHHRHKPIQPEINQNIKSAEVLLVHNDKTELMKTADALILAQEEKLDLVIINKNSKPIIAKIMDYSKFLYTQKRKNKLNKKKSNLVKVKTITVKPQISDHDLEWKANKSREWLSDNDRVQFIIQAFGRMGTKIELINSVYEKFTKLISDLAEPQSTLKKISHNQYEIYYVPLKSKIKE